MPLLQKKRTTNRKYPGLVDVGHSVSVARRIYASTYGPCDSTSIRILSEKAPHERPIGRAEAHKLFGLNGYRGPLRFEIARTRVMDTPRKLAAMPSHSTQVRS
jgi:hypothetical protein